MHAPFPLDPWCAAKLGIGTPFDRAGIEREQYARLRATLAWAMAHSPFYRRHLAGIDPGALDGPAALARLPLTCADDVRRNQPSLLCVSQREIQRIVTLDTSATSGPAKRLYFTADEQEDTIDFFRHGMAQMTARGDRVLILFPCERPGGVGQLLATALERLGAQPIPAGPIVDMPATLALLARERPQCVAGLPVQVRALARCDRLRGPTGSVRTVLISADQVAPQLRQDIADDWQCEVFEHYGMTETGLGGAVDCRAHQGRHLREADLLVEIVDPVSGRPLADGMRGEVVISTLTRRGMPLIRYRSGDLSRLLPGPCPCGSPLRRLDAIERAASPRLTLDGGQALTLAGLDQTLFALDWLTDYSATLQPGPPPRLQLVLHGASGAPDAAALTGAASLLGRDPAIRAAREQRGLTFELVRGTGPLRPRGGKRTLERPGT